MLNRTHAAKYSEYVCIKVMSPQLSNLSSKANVTIGKWWSANIFYIKTTMQDMEHLRDFKWLELAISYSLKPQQLPKQFQAWPRVVSTIKWNPFQMKILVVGFWQHNSIVQAYIGHHQYILYMRSRAYISQRQLFNTGNMTRKLMLFLSISEAHILCMRYSWESYAHGWEFASKSLKFAPDWWLRMHDYNHKVYHQVGRVECASPKLSEAV